MGAVKKKKRAYRGYTGRRSDVREGAVVDHNIQVNDLPDVGQYVVVNELRYLSEVYRNSPDKISTIYEYNDAYLDSKGNPIVYQVEGYSKSQENALDPTNKVFLVSKSENGLLTRRTQIRTILIATGSLELELVDPQKLKAVGFRAYDTYNLMDVANMRVVERTIKQGQMERICRQGKHL